MTCFALDLDHNGIRLLRRQGGEWFVLETAALDDPGLAQKLAAMRESAEALSDGPLETELLIPETQILYTKIDLPNHETPPDAAVISAALDGLTPCPVEEMVFDWRVLADGVAVAALDVNTLDEAENFAVTYGFNPVRFSARPRVDQFPDLPDFGPTQFVQHQAEAAPPAIFASRRTAAPVKADETPQHNEPDQPIAAAAPPLTEGSSEPAVSIAPAPSSFFGGPDPTDTVAEAEDLPHAAKPEPADTDRPVATVEEDAADHEVASDASAEEPEQPQDRPAPAGRSIPKAPPLSAPRPAERRTVARNAARVAATRSPSWRKTAVTVGAGASLVTVLLALALYLVTPEPMPDAQRTTHLALPADPSFTPLSAPPLGGVLPDGLTPIIAGRESDVTPAAMARRAGAGQPGPGALTTDRAVDPPGTLRSADVWQTPPPPPPDPVGETLDTLYLAAIDPELSVGDAVALGDAAPVDGPPTRRSVPPAADRTYDLDATGRVVATQDGAETPDGITVTLGQPPVLPPARPERVAADTLPVTIVSAGQGAAPRSRPGGLVERNERAQLGGRTRAELAQFKPRLRPASPQETTVTNASLVPSQLAVTSSPNPPRRPADLDARAVAAAVASARPDDPAPVPEQRVAAVAPVEPSIPTTASVARQATISNAINLKRVNLIGVYGSANDRRALVRLPSGRYVKLEVGDRVDGGRVSSIGEGELMYVKSGRRVRLTVPSG